MISLAKSAAAMILVLGAGSAAVAQERPSFDCTKADNVIDRTICNSGELAKADRELATAYTALLGKHGSAATYGQGGDY